MEKRYDIKFFINKDTLVSPSLLYISTLFLKKKFGFHQSGYEYSSGFIQKHMDKFPSIWRDGLDGTST